MIEVSLTVRTTGSRDSTTVTLTREGSSGNPRFYASDLRRLGGQVLESAASQLAALYGDAVDDPEPQPQRVREGR